jgi:hypothetical protein
LSAQWGEHALRRPIKKISSGFEIDGPTLCILERGLLLAADVSDRSELRVEIHQIEKLSRDAVALIAAGFAFVRFSVLANPRRRGDHCASQAN